MDECTKIAGFGAATSVEISASGPVDNELVAAVRSGDEAAFELLFERHRRSVTRLAYRFFSRREQVEDIVQESFASAYFGLDGFRGGQDNSFKAWLSRITVRTCYDAIRRLRKTESSISELSAEEVDLLCHRTRGPDSKHEFEKAAISRDLAEKLLARLDPDDRIVLSLMNGDDLSISEISDLTGWSAPKIKMRAFRARASLRRVLHRYI